MHLPGLASLWPVDLDQEARRVIRRAAGMGVSQRLIGERTECAEHLIFPPSVVIDSLTTAMPVAAHRLVVSAVWTDGSRSALVLVHPGSSPSCGRWLLLASVDAALGWRTGRTEFANPGPCLCHHKPSANRIAAMQLHLMGIPFVPFRCTSS